MEQGQEILRNSGLNFTVANGMKDGAEKVVALAVSAYYRRRSARMSVLVDENTRVIVQGITGREGSFPRAADASNTAPRSSAASRPAKAARRISTCPFSTPSPTPCDETGANASVIFVPPPFAADAILEAADAGLPLVICITEGIPALDMVRVAAVLQALVQRA